MSEKRTSGSNSRNGLRRLEGGATPSSHEMTLSTDPVTIGISAGSAPQPGLWGALLTFRFPRGTARHPRVLDLVEQRIGRICAIDTDDQGVRVSFGTYGTTVDEARRDASGVAEDLLTCLGLPETAVIERRLIPRDAELARGRGHLVALSPEPLPEGDAG